MSNIILRVLLLVCLVGLVLCAPPAKPAGAANSTVSHVTSADVMKPQHLHPHIEMPFHKPSALLSFGKAVADIPVAIVETCKDVAEGIASLVKGFFISLLNR